jgi:hypothetical protein
MARNSSVYLIAAADENYLQKAMPYLRTVNQRSNIHTIFFTVDFDITEEHKGRFPEIVFRRINSAVVKSPNSNKCIQHGGFLEELKDFDDSAVIMFTDTDIIVQRPFSQAELHLLENCADKDVFANLNYSALKKTSLIDDAAMMCRPTVSLDVLKAKYERLSEYVIYNTGVIAANCRTYRALYERYNEYWPELTPLLASYVKQQWLLSYIIQRHFHPRELPYSIHCNAYSPPFVNDAHAKRGCYTGESTPVGFKLCIGSDVVALNHHIRHESQLTTARLRRSVRWLTRISVVLAAVCLFLLVSLLW